MYNQGLAHKIDKIAIHLPEKIALKCGKKTLNYYELAMCSNKIASIIKNKVIKSQNVIVLSDRSMEAVISIIGILKVGKVFVPIDPMYPNNRMSYMLEEVASDLIITTKAYATLAYELVQKAVVKPEVLIIDLESNQKAQLRINDEVQELIVELIEEAYEESCYIYFTSGSTGRPKGILGKQSSLMHYLEWEIDTFKVTESYKVSQLISPSFDPYLRDVFIPLLVGGTLVIPPEHEIILDNKRLMHWLEEEKINLMHMGKTLFNKLFLQIKTSNDLSEVKCILLSGESLRGVDIKKAKALFGEKIELVNLYGPTETTLAAAYHITTNEDANCINVPIGRGIQDVDIYVLDQERKPCKEGEIYIATAYATQGYYANEQLTNEKFIEHGKKVLYQTGDIGQVLENGEVVCLGRKDRQLKINGVRIELGEIEAVLVNKFKHREFVVVVQQQGERSYLVCYYVGEVISSQEEIISTLKEELPQYMIPARYTHLESFPMLPNGKIDVKSLMQATKDDEKVCFLSQLEEEIATLIESTIHIKVTSAEENMLYLGASSLDAVSISAEIYHRYKVAVPSVALLKDMTLRHIAKYVEETKTEILHPVHCEERKSYLMAPVQRNLFLIHQIKKESIAYNVTEAINIKGDLKSELVEQAYKEIIKQNAILRTKFYMDAEGQFLSTIEENGVLDFRVLDVSQESSGDFYSTRLKEIITDFVKSFKVDELPLFRVLLIKLKENDYMIIQDSHHIILDGMSNEIVFKQVVKYITEGSISKSQYTYQDYSTWSFERLQSGDLDDAKAYWYEQFKSNNESLELPMDFNRTVDMKETGDSVEIILDKGLTEKIRTILKEYKKTVSTFLLTVFSVLLSRYGGEEYFTVGIPTLGREHPEFERMLGMFVNTLPLSVKVNEESTISEIMDEIFEHMVLLLKYQGYPFSNIVEDLKIKPDLSRNPLFDIIFNFLNVEGYEIDTDNMSIRRISLPQASSKFNLSLIAYEGKENIQLSFQYDKQLFRESTIKRMASHYMNLLQQILINPNAKVRALNPLSTDELDYLKAQYQISNQLTEKTVIDMFLEQVEKNPEKVAITLANKQITYRQLDEMSNLIARHICETNLKENRVVGILLKRSEWLIASIIGALRAGFAYLPIDPEYPADRISYMLENSQCHLMISDEETVLAESCQILNIHNLAKASNEISINLCNKKDLAYLIYTSGSTGKPKGVMITNSNLSSFCNSIKEIIPFDQDKRILCVTTVCFDIFVLETIVPLVTGGEIVLANEAEQKSPYELSEMIIEHKVNIIQFTPSRLQLFIGVLDEMACLKEVQHLIVGGEAFDKAILNHVQPNEKLNMYNIYGPTEATVWCAVKKIDRDGILTIGKPFSNTRMYVLDELQRIQPIGVVGELYIGGACISEGYINQEALTSERFIENPFISGEKIYKTGDRARLLENGEFDFLGRTDFQVKLRGFRVELNEIEKCMLDYEGIKKCVCNLYEGENNEKCIVAYYIADQEIDIANLRSALSKYLPQYMIPEIFMLVKEMPYTLNGKINHKALPKPQRQGMITNRVVEESTNEVEKKLQDIWKDILGIDCIGINDNFFDIGGNSALLVRMHYKVMKEWHKEINVSNLFSNPTISKLSKNLLQQDRPKKVIKEMVLSEDFFAVSGASQEYGLNGELEIEVYEDLQNICNAYGIKIEQILLALYAYTLSVISHNECFELYREKESLCIEEIGIDLSKHEGIIEMAEALSGTFETFAVDELTLNKAKAANSATIVYRYGERLTNIESLPFDISTYLKTEDTLHITCYYNNTYINGEKVEELVSLYMNIVEAFVAKENEI